MADILYIRQSNVRFNVNGHTLYGENVCDGEIAPKFCQPVKTDDETQFQLVPCDFNRNDIILNGGFTTQFDWDLGTGWTIDNSFNRADCDGSLGGGTMSQVLTGLEAGTLNVSTYEVRFGIAAFADNGSGNNLTVRLGGAFLALIDLTTTPFPNREFIFDIITSTPSNELLEFIAQDDVSFNVKNVEVRRAPCSLTQLISFPTFPDGSSGWTFGGSWFATGQQAVINKNNSGTLEQAIGGGLNSVSYYRLEFAVEGIDLTSPGGADCVVKLGGETITTITTSTTIGTKYFNFYLETPTDDNIQFINTNLGLVIDNCTLYMLSAPAYIVEDCDGNLIDSFDINDGESSNNTSVIQYTQDWGGYDNGCYQIKVFDSTKAASSELIQNGGFISPDSDWTVGTNWSIPSPQDHAIFSGAFTGILANVLGQTIAGMVADKIYKVEYDVVSWVDTSGGGDGSMTSNIGTILLDTFTSAAAVGPHVHIISTKGVVIFTSTFIIQSTTTSLDVVIDNVSVKEMDIEACSECFQVNNWLDSKGCEKTRLLTATNNDDAFGYDFTNFDLTLSMRVFARHKHETYQQSVFESRHTRTNSRVTNYAESVEVLELIFDRHPAYIYNMVQIMSDADIWKIDGVNHSKEDGGLVPEWLPRLLAATMTMIVFVASQPNRINDNP